jgi:hypothetical protein
MCGLLVPVTFIGGWLLGGLAQPAAYSLVEHDISDLGAVTADQPWLYNQIGANLTGLLVLGLVPGLWRTVGGLAGRIGVGALAVMGAGQTLDGLFRIDCREIDTGCGAGDPSWHAVAHLVETNVTILALLVSVFVLPVAFARTPAWRSMWPVTLAAAVGTIAATVVLGFVGPGLAVRAGTTVWFVWVALLGRHLLAIAGSQPLPARPLAAA